MGQSCVRMKTVKNHERMELSWANNVYNTEFSVEKPFRTWFAHINHVIPVKITFCTLFSLLQRLKRFKATYSEKPQTNAIFMRKLVPNN